MTSIRFMALWLSLVLATLSYATPPRSQGGASRTDTINLSSSLKYRVLASPTLNRRRRPIFSSTAARLVTTNSRRNDTKKGRICGPSRYAASTLGIGEGNEIGIEHLEDAATDGASNK
jgi:hypothetical protein